MSSLIYGLRNFWRFRHAIYRWRSWSFEYNYELFVRALELQADHLEACDRHEGRAEDVARIRKAVKAWEEHQGDRPALYPSLTAYRAATQRHWDRFHDICKFHGREWWD